MGSGSSKQNVASSSFSSSLSPSPSQSPSPPLTSPSVRRSRSYRSRGVFNSSCLRSQHHSRSHNADSQMFDNRTKRNGFDGCCANGTMPDSNEVKNKCCRKVKVQQPDELNCVTSNIDSDDWNQSRGGRMSQAFSSRGLNPSSHFLSRLNIFPGNISFSMNRANSLGSARHYIASSTRFQMTNNEDEPSTSGSMIDENDGIPNHNHFPRCFSSRSPVSPGEDLVTGDLLQSASTRRAAREGVDPGVDSGENSFSRNCAYNEGTEERLANRRIGAEETVEQNVRFSRTLSVGRLRDRVLRRTSFPDFAFGPFEQDRDTEHASQVSEGQILGAGRRPISAEENSFSSQASSSQSRPDVSGSLHRHNGDTPRPREARYHDLLEYRSNFLERRRRIRSQVRALQRLGSRFEDISAHERSCILSGQHGRGHCTCRINPREADSNGETSARASISRIVMLAEALFEVLDEIHQQSVVLSSRPSMSSLGSVPAPNEVVDSLPVRLYSKLQKHLQDEVAQCYVCLVEYEEGDSVRVLPCRHEYHKACIDKWLKEIHRVCPLCRGDVCRPDPLPANI